jgi:hypothetical protein
MVQGKMKLNVFILQMETFMSRHSLLTINKCTLKPASAVIMVDFLGQGVFIWVINRPSICLSCHLVEWSVDRHIYMLCRHMVIYKYFIEIRGQ